MDMLLQLLARLRFYRRRKGGTWHKVIVNNPVLPFTIWTNDLRADWPERHGGRVLATEDYTILRK